MSSNRWVASQVQTLFEAGTLNGLSELQLLERFARHGDQAAFEALLARHGPMVLGVCRRILGDAADVDDAFQATILVLVRRATTLGPGDVIAAWLHGVATRVARRARSDRMRRERRERTGPAPEPPSTESRSPDFALKAVIDEEVERLPWKYRAPVALCYLEGLTHEEAARRLDWPVGTVKGRLARARALLGARLGRRGVATGAGAVAGAVALEGLAGAAVVEALRGSVLRTAVRFAEGAAWRSVISHQVVHLSEGAIASMFVTKIKAAASGLAIVGLLAAGARVAARQPGEDPQPEPRSPVPAVAARPEPARPDLPGLAPTAAARPEDRFLADARHAFLAASEDHAQNRVSLERVYRASRLLLDAQKERAKTPDERQAAFAEHRDRLRVVSRADLVENRDSGGASSPVAEARAMLAEADLWLARGRTAAEPPMADELSQGGATPSDHPGGKNLKTAAVLKKLEEPLAMNFPNETPLEDVLKYVKQATETPDFPGGIPVYVDPIGLQEADRSSTSPIVLELEGVPLKRTLQLLLRPLGLVYFVEDGMIVITASTSESGLGPEMSRPSPLVEEVEKANRGEMTMDEMKNLIEKLKLIQEIRQIREGPAKPVEKGFQ
ncbi:sigma-70 family RNA polymerase sigma factor [Paludisphaera mucosa]|uniref:Sigma-70 family RNA polymerase sigma factor n=1 Tax=Paludisphaera mucosa TaxID=3030827 RepID=A0ABT6FGJ4_9BACT|nr:sigma-70 family RNA polymerase sigma factor [Paludisphaera mucosa]MDG3006520.1 sigma-70 family RNA polymerase sigma factor [Paludisphaera mucosa]